ncbi:hypothetical protein ACIA03_01880 [Nocardioides sp. NPDC051685]|uniref:hypothetical protein n=1 Tax=Nocardioides sp. NPDC051685 TaxID=3364334 RepID=UPI0037BC17B5
MTAATGLNDTIEALKKKDVEDFVPTSDMLGSDEVWSAVEEFKDRWEEGLNNLSEDVTNMAGTLGKVAANYAELDSSGADLMKTALAAARDLGGHDA